MRHLCALLQLLALCTLPLAVRAQTVFPFRIRVELPNDAATVPNGAALNISGDAVGAATKMRVTVTNTGVRPVRLGTPQLFGSDVFTITAAQDQPFLTVAPGAAATAEVTFTPRNAAQARAQFAWPFSEVPDQNTSVPVASGTITLDITGNIPQVSISYALQPDNNVVAVSDGGRIVFPPAALNTPAQGTLIITNRGSGTAALSGLTIQGDAFQLVGVPGFPLFLAGGAEVRLGLRYTPRAARTDTGSLRITLGTQTLTIALEGSGIGSAFSYEVQRDGATSPVQPNGTITFADAEVGGERGTLTVVVRNSSSSTATVTNFEVTGVGFTVVDPPVLPQVLGPGGSLTATLGFSPLQPGRVTGRLRVGNDVFTLAGNGLGARLTYAFGAGDALTSVVPGGTVLFSPQAVGQSGTVQIRVQNTGTTATVLTSIGVADPRSPFQVRTLPTLPQELAPGAAVTFPVVFAPVTTGLASGQLLINGQLFNLNGVGTAPPPLPGVRFTGVSGTVQPFEQPAIGLTLAAPYSLPVRGVLNLVVNSGAAPADPAVQFATGGRTVPFVIPSGSTQAVFGNGLTEVRLQTGTVASTFTVTPSFTTESGLDLTPTTVDSLRLTVAAGPPRLLTVRIADRTATGATLLITGYAPSRSLTRLELQFNQGTSEITFQNLRASVSLQAEATAWFLNPSSASFGGQFSVIVPVTIRLSSGTPTGSLLDRLDSVTVSAVNESGTSNTVTSPLR